MQQIRVNIRGVVNLRLEDLNAFQEDIKILTDDRYLALKTEILEDGFSFSPHVFQDGDGKFWILDGHQRRTCLERMRGEGYEVPIIPCMEVDADSLEHARRLVLAGTSQYGTFQPKKLVAFVTKLGLEPPQVIDRFVLPIVGFDKIVGVKGHTRTLTSDEQAYSKKVKSPVYEPTGDCPAVSALCDMSKTDQLRRELADAPIAKEVLEFLFQAAARHTIFDYRAIAEYYAHAPKEVQELMEKSALVIVDFGKAIENGFVEMSKELAEAYPNEE